MKNLEDWFLDRFMPWFMQVSQAVGALTIIFGLSYCIVKPFLGWEVTHIFTMTLVIGFLIYGINSEAKDRRLTRQVKELLNEENDNILKMINEKGFIDSSELNNIIFRIYRNLDPETSAHLSGEKELDGSDKVYKKIKDVVWPRCCGLSDKNKKIQK